MTVTCMRWSPSEDRSYEFTKVTTKRMRTTIQSNFMQTILVIDDDESLRDTIGVMLEQEGFRAVLTGDGRDGFEKTMTLKPDLALVDLRLPGMSGIDICKQLRSANVSTPIIILSAAGDEFDK